MIARENTFGKFFFSSLKGTLEVISSDPQMATVLFKALSNQEQMRYPCFFFENRLFLIEVFLVISCYRNNKRQYLIKV